MTATANETIKPGYLRVMQGIYKRGEKAAVDYYGRTPPKNPYKMTNYRKMWQMGFDNFTKSIQEANAELEARERLESAAK